MPLARTESLRPCPSSPICRTLTCLAFVGPDRLGFVQRRSLIERSNGKRVRGSVDLPN